MRAIHIKQFNIRLIIYLCILTISSVMLPILSSPSSALTLEDDRAFSVSVDYSMGIVLSSTDLTIPIYPTDTGQFGRTSTSVYVDTNNIAGYTLTLQSNTDKLTNTKLGTTIDPLDSPISCTIESDDTCDTFPTNQWGYRIGATGSYLPATDIVNKPIELAHTDTVTTTTDPVATLYFGTKIDTHLPTGTYDGVELTFIATANIQKYNVTLLPTAGITSITLDNESPCTDTTKGCVYALEKDSEHTIKATVADNYTFTGWTNATEHGTFSDSTNPTTTFTVGEGDTVITASTNAITHNITVIPGTGISKVQLDDQAECATTTGCTYPLHQGTTHALKATPADGYNFEKWTKTSGVGTLAAENTQTAASTSFTVGTGEATLTATGEVAKTYMQNMDASVCTDAVDGVEVYDNRDGQRYVIKKLADNNCWMMTNLNLTSPTVDLTSNNTNIEKTVTRDTFIGWKKTSGSGTINRGEFISISGSDSTTGTPYGTLYNYYATTANTIVLDTFRSNPQDICPAGWRLPNSNELAALYGNGAYNTPAKMHGSIASGGAAFTFSGVFYNSQPVNTGVMGGLWSSTPINGAVIYYLYIDSSIVYPTYNIDRSNGLSIRCVLK